MIKFSSNPKLSYEKNSLVNLVLSTTEKTLWPGQLHKECIINFLLKYGNMYSILKPLIKPDFGLLQNLLCVHVFCLWQKELLVCQ